jgi:hypothetical protein
MISLKSYIGRLSGILGMTPDALYERQRVLVRSGQLTGAIAGKGPGSGVRATVRNVTRLLLSTLAADALFEIDEKTRKLAALKQVNGKCPLTGELRLQNAMEQILASPELAKSVLSIDVRREDLGASVNYKTALRHPYESSHFGRPRRRPTDPPFERGRLITATLEGWCIEMIADDLHDIAAGVPPRNHG